MSCLFLCCNVFLPHGVIRDNSHILKRLQAQLFDISKRSVLRCGMGCFVIQNGPFCCLSLPALVYKGRYVAIFLPSLFIATRCRATIVARVILWHGIPQGSYIYGASSLCIRSSAIGGALL